MSAKRLATFGERGNLQRLYFDAARPKPYYIQVGTRRKQWSFATRGEAEAFLRTEGWKLSAIAATMTQRELFTAYMDSVRRDLSPSTIRSAIYAWEKWEAFIDATAVVDAIGPMACSTSRRSSRRCRRRRCARPSNTCGACSIGARSAAT